MNCKQTYAAQKKFKVTCSSKNNRVSIKFEMRYLFKNMSQDDEILLDRMLQDPLQDNNVAQNIHGKINIYLLHNLTV